jgi:hypothetical protein
LLFSLFSTDFCGLRVLFGTEGTEINAWNNDLFIELLYLIGIRGVLPSIRDWRLAHQMNERAHSLDLRGTIKYRDWCVRVSMYGTVRSRVRIFLVYVQPSVLLPQCLLVKEQEIFSEIWHTSDWSLRRRFCMASTNVSSVWETEEEENSKMKSK